VRSVVANDFHCRLLPTAPDHARLTNARPAH
jgi:hypothetical protein